MNVTNLESIYQGVVKGQVAVTIEITKEDAQELREALKIIDHYKKIAIRAVKENKIDGVQHSDPTESDWHMVEYAVKNDKVIVSLTDGMAG